MKKTKRVVAFVLVLAFVFAFMAMSASAAMTEVQPRGTCPQCINGYVTSTIQMKGTHNPNKYEEIGYGECSNMTMPHRHYEAKYDVWVDCNNCSYYGVSYSYTGCYFCVYA